MNTTAIPVAIAKSANARDSSPAHNETMFRQLFERSADAMFLSDPRREIFVDCNQAAVEMMRASSKEQLLHMNPADLSPEFQPDGRNSRARVHEDTTCVLAQGSHRFEWWGRRMDGTEFPVEVLLTPIHTGGQTLIAAVCRDITERKRAESELLELTQALECRVSERTAELSASEARFRALVEHAPEAIVVYSVDTGRFLFGNQHACDLYGVPMSKLPEVSPADVSPEFQPCGRRTCDLVSEKIHEVMAGGVSVFDWVHKQADGRLISTEVRLLRLPAEGQTLIRASIIDNAERKRAEEALRESEAKFRSLFEGTSNGVVLMAPDKLLEVNPAALRILGRRSPEEMVGRHPSAFSPLLQPNGACSEVMAQQHIEECIAKGSLRLEWVCSSPEGREIPLEVLLTRIEWSGRQVIQACITDITERKGAEAALAESEARFRSAFQACPIVISIARVSDGRYVLINDAFVDWSGYARGEIVGKTAQELGLWADMEDRQNFWADLRRTGSIREQEWRLRNRAGREFVMLVSCELIHLNHVPHILGMALDITERKQAEADTQKALAREKELSQLKGNFVSMVSHEFRTPLSIIRSSAELLGEFFEKMPPDQRQEQLASITRNTRRMAGMMEEILVLSRLDAGKLEFQPSPVDLNGVCRRIVDEVLSATSRRCSIELLLNSIPTEALADERLLRYIFTNLLSNAVKYSEAGMAVHFFVARDGPDAVCVIRDKGIGIPPEDQRQLFSTFHRGSNVGTRPGTGLGLLLVKRCTDLHSGKVQAVSELGEGTTVTVRFPAFLDQP